MRPSLPPLRLAFIGCGRFGEYLGDFIAASIPDAQIVAVVDPNPGRRAFATERYLASGYETVDDLLEGTDEFDAGLVLSPNGSHCSDSVRLLATGHHVFCEKPMAVTTSECEQMISAATT